MGETSCCLGRDTRYTFAKYLVSLPKCYYTPILKLRSGNHKLPVARGRYTNIVREHRYCDLCDRNILGDEYHCFVECQNDTLVQYGNCYIPRYYRIRPSMLKCATLFGNLENKKVAVKLGTFLNKAFTLVK